MIQKYYILLLVLLCGMGTLQAQSLKRFKIKAVEAYEAKDFSRALEYYQMIINEADDETAENFYNAGEAAREFRIYELAEQYYRQVLQDSVASQTYRLTNFHLGSVLKNQGRYDEAIRYFENFLAEDASFVNEDYTQMSNKEIEDCQWAKTLQDSGALVNHMDSTINTANSEFNPVPQGDQLYYSSVRYNTDNENQPEAPLTRMYVSKLGEQGQLVSGDFNVGEKHYAHAAFNKDATRMYYTICESMNATDIKCDIYSRKRETNQWGEKEALSGINKEGYTSTQPAIGFDEKAGKEVLFFVSDRPTDDEDNVKDLNIWCSYLADGTFGAPFYIANVNTAGDDVTPSFNSDTQTLYFSSNGRRNMGGFDIYSISRNLDGWGIVQHMGTPINSSYDDVYYSTNYNGTMAYLSSNRKGAICNEENNLCGCNDIYEIPQIKIKVLTYNKITGEPLNGTEVTLEQLKSKLTDVQSKPNDYQYDYSGNFNVEYQVDAILDGYIPDDSLFNTMNVKGGAVIEIPLYLTPAVEVDVLTFNKITGEPLPGATVTLYEVPEDELYADLDSLDSQYGPSSVQYNYGLNFGKRYMIVGTKPGYSRDTSYRTITTGIPVEPTKLLDELRLCKTPPGPEVVRLYFFNDEPNPDSRSPKTNWSYQRAYDNYLSYRQDFNVQLGYSPEELTKFERFFEEDVKGGYNDLQEFTRLIKGYLVQMEDDEKLIVMIRGFASPRYKQASNYNYILTQRRIRSIQNYFDTVGLLDGYEGRVEVREDPKGHETAPEGVSFDMVDVKSSIYSAAASKERRVEITRVLVAPDSCDPEID